MNGSAAHSCPTAGAVTVAAEPVLPAPVMVPVPADSELMVTVVVTVLVLAAASTSAPTRIASTRDVKADVPLE